MKRYFKINYEFDINRIHSTIKERINQEGSDYICVADGVILNIANRNPRYLSIVNGGLFSICDSSYVPIYIKLLYGDRYQQYCGSQIFEDIIKNYDNRMIFLGSKTTILDSLKNNLAEINPSVKEMTFLELPFKNVDDFNYAEIAQIIEKDAADIIWIALGAPKQEIFMNKLKPHLNHGVMIGVGAVFKFYSGIDSRRAPKFMVKYHLEFLYRIISEPKKQLRRCAWILYTLPKLLWKEYFEKKRKEKSSIQRHE